MFALSAIQKGANLISIPLFVQGAKAGIAVGVIVAALLLIGGGAFFFLKKRKAAKQTAASAGHLPNYNEAHGAPAGATPAEVAAMGEKPRI